MPCWIEILQNGPESEFENEAEPVEPPQGLDSDLCGMDSFALRHIQGAIARYFIGHRMLLGRVQLSSDCNFQPFSTRIELGSVRMCRERL